MSEDRVFPLISHLVNHEPLNGISKVVNGSEISQIRTYMEIGVSDGFTLSCRLRECLQLEELVLCDTWGPTDGGTNRGSHEHIVNLLREFHYPLERVSFLDGDSQVTIPEYFFACPDKVFDLVFVDGGHRADDLWQDMKNTVGHARILAIHDVRNPNHLYLRDLVYAFYEEIRERFVLIDDGYDLVTLFSRDLFNWEA